MNTRKSDPASTPSAIGKIPFGKPDLPVLILLPTQPIRRAQTRPEALPTPGRKGLLLDDELGRRKANPPWPLVERVLHELNPGRGNSFACLSAPGNTYVQCLRGFNGWHLEWRVTGPSGAYVHYRACRHGGSKKPFELKKHDGMNSGEHRDLLALDDVIGAFRAFHQGLGLPESLVWRQIDI